MHGQARIDELAVENAALRARVTELNEQVALLAGKVADLVGGTTALQGDT